MGHSEKTTNLLLPIITDSDKPTWRGDFNYAMRTLDGKLGSDGASATAALTMAMEAKDSADESAARVLAVETVVEGISDAADRLSDVDSQLTSAIDLANGASTSARNATRDAASALTRVESYDSRITGVESGLTSLGGRVLELEGSPGGGGGGGESIAWAKRARLKVNHVAVSSNERWRTIECNADQLQTDGTGAFSSGGISVPASGIYKVNAVLVANLMNSATDMQIRLGISLRGSDADPVTWIPMHRSDGASTRLYVGTLTDIVNVPAGGTIYLVTLLPNNSSTPLVPDRAGTSLMVERIS